MKKPVKKQKKRAPLKMEILQPGQSNAFWDVILELRDSGDPRWLGTFSHGFRYSAEMYERNRNAGQQQRAA
ncbi:MAG: hypothetical protein M3447_10415 [Acidobacteriota bacterium]|nr:hypothetical protein [Acidobacteriota bacterium]